MNSNKKYQYSTMSHEMIVDGVTFFDSKERALSYALGKFCSNDKINESAEKIRGYSAGITTGDGLDFYAAVLSTEKPKAAKLNSYDEASWTRCNGIYLIFDETTFAPLEKEMIEQY